MGKLLTIYTDGACQVSTGNGGVGVVFIKDNEVIKLSKYERKLFELFISTNNNFKTYNEIEFHLFNNCEENTKKLRNLIGRLKTKLNCDLFETIYSHGYTLKYEED